ncbi:MAG: hypothetical protein CM15mP84_06490 [Cellvibrionales bacterium]|nr:MAG: hypothetical protein CM15mP84_06490 [Cellvibrionales bacterium]
MTLVGLAFGSSTISACVLAFLGANVAHSDTQVRHRGVRKLRRGFARPLVYDDRPLNEITCSGKMLSPCLCDSSLSDWGYLLHTLAVSVVLFLVVFAGDLSVISPRLPWAHSRGRTAPIMLFKLPGFSK